VEGKAPRMALAESSYRVTHRGTWPGKVTFRRGWSRADARPWNDGTASGSLRLLRGGGAFLGACTEQLLALGTDSVISPPLPTSARTAWREAGYSPFIDLALMRLSLDSQPKSPSHLVVVSDDTSIEDLLMIDAAAFDDFWRFDAYGLSEAIEATGRSSILVIRDGEGHPAGFAVVGYGNAISYLQRVAVHPDWQGQGMGRSLIRVAARKARAAGAQVMLLNTQYDNNAAIRLYEAEGFVLLPEALALLRNSG
jgi:ribosomal protein S18 acetylase RimI-like enzyme